MNHFPYIAVCFILGCSDYNLFEKKQSDDADLVPDLVVDPSPLDVGIICESTIEDTTYTIEVQNQGLGPLEISAIEMEGWILLNNPCPIEVPTMESIGLSVKPMETAEDGVLTIYSNDPDQDIWQVPLSGQLDSPLNSSWLHQLAEMFWKGRLFSKRW